MDLDDCEDGISFSSKGSSISGFGRCKMRDQAKMTATWRQLYLSRAKLKAVSRTSALIAGFAMIAMVEVQLDSSVKYPPVLLVTFSTVTTLLVSVHLFALMISTCLLPNIEAISNIHSLNAAKYSPHLKMRSYIEVSWILSTGIGLILFLVEIALLIWLKFIGIRGPTPGNISLNNSTISSPNGDYGDLAAWLATAMLVPAVLFFAGFAVHFYRSLAQHKFGVFNSFMKEFDGLELKEDDISSHPYAGSERFRLHQDVSRMHSASSDCSPRYHVANHCQAPEDEKSDVRVINETGVGGVRSNCSDNFDRK